MPFAQINSVSLKYEILGNDGPWVALAPGGRRAMDEISGVAVRVAAAGFRVLIHDRRNTGQSALSLDGEGSEFEIWADDLYQLLRHLGVDAVIAGGSSSGCRLSTILTLRHPELVKALLMMRVTGGPFAVKRLAYRYYTMFIEAAERGGMSEVCATDHFKDLIALKPSRREEIMGWDVARFVDVMTRWRSSLEADIDKPILGATQSELRSISCPACVIPGNDKTHSIAIGRLAQSLIPGAELRELRTDQLDADIIPMSEWVSDEALAPEVISFFRGVR
jgi:pimeloyl-ACP methyl ester carboxylesterase